MNRTNAEPARRIRRATRSLVAAAVVSALTAPALAQSVDELVTYRPDNRAGTTAAAATIAEMIAERSQSEAVRSRARSLAPEGSLTVGADELLIDIGAHAFVGAITGGGSVVPAAVTPAAVPPATVTPVAVTPAAVPPPAEPEAAIPAPVIERAAPPAPVSTPAVAATPAPTPAEASPEAPRRNWGISESFSNGMRDLGGSPSGGGGSGGGGGGAGGGGGGGGWN